MFQYSFYFHIDNFWNYGTESKELYGIMESKEYWN